MSLEFILLALAVICLGLAQHPFVTYPLSLKLLKKFWPHRPKPLPASREPINFSICMCAYNEEGVIRDKMQNLLALDGMAELHQSAVARHIEKIRLLRETEEFENILAETTSIKITALQRVAYSLMLDIADRGN